MTNVAHDLWPDTFGVLTVTPPVKILREQAAALGKKTRNVVQGYVTSTVIDNDTTFHHTFYLKVPALDDYLYSLFRVQHGPNFYPVTITKSDRFARSEKYDAEEQFVEGLRRLFSEDATRDLIQALMVQSAKV